MRRSTHPEVCSSQTPSREVWEWYPLETVRDGFQSYVMLFWSVCTTNSWAWSTCELWWLILFVCWKYFFLFSCHFKPRYFLMTMFSFHFWYSKKNQQDGLYLLWHSMMSVNTVVIVCLLFVPKWEVFIRLS